MIGGSDSQLAELQEAVGRLADVVAAGVTPDAVLAEIAARGACLTGAELVAVQRIGAGGASEVVALSGTPPAGVVVGTRVPWTLGLAASAEVPVTIQGRRWGTMVAGVRDEDQLATLEERLADFARLVTPAIADAEARTGTHELVTEQAALRRVAELAARANDPSEVFAAVAAEASRLVDGEEVFLLRLAGPDTCQILATTSALPLSEKLYPLEPGDISVVVRDTGLPARIDDAIAQNCGMAREWGVVAAVGAPVVVDDRIWGALTATSQKRPLPPETERRLSQFAALAAVAVANAESRAQLIASRARVVAAADEARFRLQRDVHDGAQQRLVQTVITLELALDELDDGDGPLRSLLEESLRHAERATAELRDLVQGILPASLRSGGLAGAVASLVAELPLPARTRIAAPRLALEIETTAYFVLAEAVANVVKHAHASAVVVEVALDATGERLEIVVEDDGVGGADLEGGSGLVGLSDRVAARGGTLTLGTPDGGGTRLRVTLPV